MYIHEFTVKNFLVHRNTKLSLSPITVLVGPNGGGKSALLDALLNFSMVARGKIKQAFGPYPYSFFATRYHGAHAQARISFEVVMSQAKEDAVRLRYRISYGQQPGADAGPPDFQILQESLTRASDGATLFDRDEVDASPLKAALAHLESDRGILASVRAAHLAGQSESGYPLVTECAKEISRFSKFRLNPYKLAEPCPLPDVTAEGSLPPRLEYEGGGMAACLYSMQETQDPTLGKIEEKMRAVAPGFSKFDFNTVGADRVAMSMQFSDDRGTVTAVRVSNGLLLFAGLMVLVYSLNRPPLMLVEEPENGLTPTALKEFYRAIRDLAFKDDPAQRSQILVSSHSPFIICEAWNGHDREFIHQVKVEDGHSVVRKFSEAVEAQQIQLQKDKTGDRTMLGLRNAEELMAGYLA